MPAPRFITDNPDLQQVFDAYADYMDRQLRIPTVNAGKNLKHYQDEDSIIFTGDDPQDPTLASTAVTFAFEVSLAPDPDNPGQYLATIQPGVINGNLFPTINSTPMWQQVSNGGSPPVYSYPQLSVKKGDTIYVQAGVTAGILSSLAIFSSSTVPTETDSLTTYKIATCDGTTGLLTQLLRNNLAYAAMAVIYTSSSRLIAHVWTTAP